MGRKDDDDNRGGLPSLDGKTFAQQQKELDDIATEYERRVLQQEAKQRDAERGV